MKTLRFYNLSHAGDAIADSIFMNALAPRPIQYMTHPRNLPHVREWFGTHVELTPYMPPGAEEIWIAQTLHGCTRGMEKFFPGCRPHPKPHEYNQVYFDHFRGICERHQLDFPFRTKDDICHTHPELYQDGPAWDWLVVNSECFSGQLVWDEPRLAEICRSLPGRVITTHPVDGLPCTQAHGKPQDAPGSTISRQAASWGHAPTLFNIGQLAGRCRFIAGINTGPLWACLTKRAMENCERLIVADKEHSFMYGNKSVWCRNLDEFSVCLGNIRRRF